VSSTSSIGFSRLGPLFGAFSLLLGGCASITPPALESVPELTAVPFFPQTEYDCGPAALATILNASEVAVTPAELIDMVYIEGLQGSLQAELMAATRRFGLLPVPVAPDPAGLLEEIASGRPVLVLQNLAFERAPVWHYAVVVGYDAERDRVILRSGEQQRRLERTNRFLRSWRLAGNWGFVAVAPGEIPASTAPDTFLRAVVGAQPMLGESNTAASYTAALVHWPDDPLVLFFAASRKQASGEFASAAALYRRVLAAQPDHAAARNNLANVLFDLGCRTDALYQARLALSQQSTDDDFYAAITDTLRRIETSPPLAPEPASCAAG